MFGSEYLVAPIFHLNEFEREVYLPEGRWEDTRDGKCTKRTDRSCRRTNRFDSGIQENSIRSCKKSKKKQYRRHTQRGDFSVLFSFRL